MIKLGYRILALGTLLILLRLLIPFEFSFTKNINLPEALSYFIAQILHPRINHYSIWHMLLVIWCIGIVYGIWCYIQDYKRLMYFIDINSTDVTTVSPYKKIIMEFSNTQKDCHRISIYETTAISSPMICGIFRPTILLPKSLSLSPTELRLVLEHEISHYLHHDLILKFVVQMICIIYWWNPMCRLFQKQVNTILEIRIDHELTYANPEQKKNYFSCLLNVAKYSVNETIFSPHVVYYCTNSHSLLQRRFEIGLTKTPKKNYIYNSFFITLLVMIYLCSHLFVFEPFYTSPEVEATTVGTMSPDFYYILDDSGIYNIYYQGEFIETADSLKYYPGIRSYDEIME